MLQTLYFNSPKKIILQTYNLYLCIPMRPQTNVFTDILQINISLKQKRRLKPVSPTEIARDKQSLLAANDKDLPSGAAVGSKEKLFRSEYTFHNLIHLFRISHLVNKRPQHVHLFILFIFFFFWFSKCRLSSSVRFLIVNVFQEHGLVHPLQVSIEHSKLFGVHLQ